MSTPVLFKSRLRTIAAVSLLTLALGASGCTRLRTHQGYIGDAVLISAVAPGVDNKESVQASLGRPTFTGQFDSNDWYYFARDSRQLAFTQPKAQVQNVVHIRFDAAGNVAPPEFVTRPNAEIASVQALRLKASRHSGSQRCRRPQQPSRRPFQRHAGRRQRSHAAHRN